MPNPLIKLPIEKLSVRGNEIRSILSLIAPNEGPAWQIRPTSTSFRIGTHGGNPSGSQVSDWYFNTIYKGFQAQYYEYWEKFEDQGQELWYLERAYFHLCKINRSRGKPDEFILLHCDPSFDPLDETEEGSESHKKRLKQAPYKQLLHLHLIEANPPFPHAHIALHIGFKDLVLESADSLSIAIQHAIKMLKDEILDEINIS